MRARCCSTCSHCYTRISHTSFFFCARDTRICGYSLVCFSAPAQTPATVFCLDCPERLCTEFCDACSVTEHAAGLVRAAGRLVLSRDCVWIARIWAYWHGFFMNAPKTDSCFASCVILPIVTSLDLITRVSTKMIVHVHLSLLVFVSTASFSNFSAFFG